MQINKSKKRTRRQSPSTLFDNDFASGFEDSKFDKFKPALKALVVIILLVGATWGVVAYFGTTDKKDGTNKNYTSNTARQEDDKLAQCAIDMEAKNPIPASGDNSFYPKLIAYYDAQIDCYDQYPGASSVVSKSSLEYARDNALDSSGSYKDTYVSFGSNSGSSTTSKNSVTGCDYSLSESEYLACSDKYYAAHSSSSTAPSNNSVGDTSTPSYTPPSTPSTPPSTSGGSSDSSSSSAADRAYWQNKCEEQVRQQSGGTSLTATQRAAMVSQCMSSHGY